MPAGTGVALSARTGNTATPDATWSAFSPIASSGGDIPGSSRYLQYRVQLTTSEPAVTPTLSDVSIAYSTGSAGIPPQTTIDSGPSGPTDDSTPTFTFHSSAAGSTFACSIDSGTPNFGPCSGPGAAHTPASPLADGSYTFRVQATDAVGSIDPTPATSSFTVDTQAPTAPNLSGTAPASPPTPTHPGSREAPRRALRCRSTPPPTAAERHSRPAPPPNWRARGSPSRCPKTQQPPSARSRPTAPRNKSPCSAALTYIEDSTPPETQIDAGPSGTITTATASFSFSSELGAVFQCSLDGAAFSSCTSPQAYSSLAEGLHTFAVRATDPAGNVDPTPATRSFTVDTLPPDTTITSGASGPTNDSTPTFGFSSSQTGSTFECRFDSAAFAPCSGPGATHTPTAALADGAHTFAVRAKDPAGNIDPTPATRAFTVDTQAPAAPSLTGTSPASPANANSPKVLGSAEAGSTVRIYSTSDCSGTQLASGTAAALGEPGDRRLGARQFDHRLPRHRDRCRRERLRLLGRDHLHRGLGCAGHDDHLRPLGADE